MEMEDSEYVVRVDVGRVMTRDCGCGLECGDCVWRWRTVVRLDVGRVMTRGCGYGLECGDCVWR